MRSADLKVFRRVRLRNVVIVVAGQGIVVCRAVIVELVVDTWLPIGVDSRSASLMGSMDEIEVHDDFDRDCAWEV